MKLIFTLLILVSCLTIRGQEYREYFDSTGFYLVQYDIDRCGIMIMPMVGYAEGTEDPNKPHYEAWVTVYQIKTSATQKKATTKLLFTTLKTDTIMIGQPFRGQYVEDGCFEDRPEDMVNHAKLLQSEMKKSKR
jgi:hypothetical protein